MFLRPLLGNSIYLEQQPIRRLMAIQWQQWCSFTKEMNDIL